MRKRRILYFALVMAFLLVYRGWANAELRKALNTADLPKIRQWVRLGADVNTIDDRMRIGRGPSPLMVAASAGNVALVREFIRRGAILDQEQEKGVTALEDAASKGHLNVVRVLIQSGANVNHQDGEGWTPLMGAAYRGHREVVELLLDSGADPNLGVPAVNGHTPITLAEEAGHTEIAELLRKLAPPQEQTHGKRR